MKRQAQSPHCDVSRCIHWCQGIHGWNYFRFSHRRMAAKQQPVTMPNSHAALANWLWPTVMTGENSRINFARVGLRMGLFVPDAIQSIAQWNSREIEKRLFFRFSWSLLIGDSLSLLWLLARLPNLIQPAAGTPVVSPCYLSGFGIGRYGKLRWWERNISDNDRL